MKKYFRKRKLGITGKVVTSMFAVVLTIMLFIASYTYTKSEKLMLQQIERELSSEIQNVEEEVFSFFKQKGEMVRQLSIMPVITNTLADNDSRKTIRSSSSYDWLQHALTDTKKSNEDVGLVWLANLEHDYFVANGDYVSDSRFTIQNRAWFVTSPKKNGPSYSPPYIDFATKKLTVSITSPVIVDNKTLGFVGVDVHLDELPTILQRFEKDGRRIILLAGDGQAIYDSENMLPIFHQTNLEEEKVTQLSSSDDLYYANIRQVRDLGWKIGIYLPKEVFLKPLLSYQLSLIFFWVGALIILLTALFFVLHHLLKDIPFITKQIKKIEHGDFNIQIGMKRQDEVGEIARTVNQMAKKIQIQMDVLNNQAHFDSLTRLPNRKSIERTLEQWIQLAKKNGQILAVTFLDLDHFKQVNDSKGHSYGDELLVQVGKRIKGLLPSNSFFGRFGGDEFVLILVAKDSDLADIQSTLQFVHDAFLNDFTVHNQSMYVTASMGVSQYPKNSQTKEELFANADTALYQAKEAGRNLIYFFNTEMKETFERQLLLENGLRNALVNNEFILHYQPQLDVRSGKTTSMEALIRWKHPIWGMVSPADFIPLTESSGQICAIGNWVIDTSLQTMKRIMKEYPYIQRIAINVSAIQLREPDFVQKLKHALDKHAVSPLLLEIEITESVIIVDEEEVIQKIKELKELGIQVALDDFGTGYSSLNYLHRMPIDRVKLDRSFIQRLEEDPKTAAILKTIIGLGHTLGLEIVAEGVENETQLQLLREMDVDSIQGFYYCRPIDESALIPFLKIKK